MNTIGEEILKLRQEGFNYNEIASKVNCYFYGVLVQLARILDLHSKEKGSSPLHSTIFYKLEFYIERVL